MNFKLLPEKNSLGVSKGMAAQLPRDSDDPYYPDWQH